MYGRAETHLWRSGFFDAKHVPSAEFLWTPFVRRKPRRAEVGRRMVFRHQSFALCSMTPMHSRHTYTSRQRSAVPCQSALSHAFDPRLPQMSHGSITESPITIFGI